MGYTRSTAESFGRKRPMGPAEKEVTARARPGVYAAEKSEREVRQTTCISQTKLRASEQMPDCPKLSNFLPLLHFLPPL